MWSKLFASWKMLNRSIYTGKRLKSNLYALTLVSIFCMALGLTLMVYDYVTGQTGMFIAATATFVFAGGCAFFAGVMKKREIAVLFPVIFCVIAFTLYTVIGVGDGTAILWTMMLPIGMCYFVSVKYGILLSVYYSVLFVVVFYTPLGDHLKGMYSQEFIARFILLYISMSAFIAISMIQYHRGILLENEYADRLNEEVERQTKVAVERAEKLEELGDEIVQTLAMTIDAKDKYTNGHSFRVSWYAVALARQLGWSEEEVRMLEREAMLHDIGKIGVPDAVLNKPGRLDSGEFEIIKSHAAMGGNILKRSNGLVQAATVARHHHERYDGNGYPDRLAGTDIPAHARVVGIADAYDAMHSDRIYRKGLEKDVIRRELINGSGSQFDPRYVEVFIRMLDDGVLDEVEKIGENKFVLNEIVA